MSDNRRVYRTIRRALKGLFPTEPKGNFARNLNTLAGMVAGIVQGKSCQLPTIARHTPDETKPESRAKRYKRWIKNERTGYEAYYMPFAQQILASLAKIRELVFTIDGSEIGHNCIILMITYLSIVKQVLSKICAPLYMGGRWNYRPICGSPRVNHIHFNADISDFDKKFAHKPRHF